MSCPIILSHIIVIRKVFKMYHFLLPKSLEPKATDDLILVGRDCDGGYFTSRSAINSSRHLVSLGVNDDWSFEKDFVTLNRNAQVNCFDGSISGLIFLKYFVKSLLFTRFRIAYHFLQTIIDFKNFFSSNNVAFHQHFVGPHADFGYVAMSDVLQEKDDVFLKIDIEGGEYRLLDDIIQYKNILSGVVIEFHDFDLHLEKILRFIDLLGMDIVHFNVNNFGIINDTDTTPTVVEISFTNRSKSLMEESGRPLPKLINNPCGYDYSVLFVEDIRH